MAFNLRDEEILRLLDDDVPCGDLTTQALGIGAAMAGLEFRARRAMVVCGSEEAVRLFQLLGAEACVHEPSGSSVGEGALLLTARGRADTLHQVWKTAQVMMEWAGGIATAAAAIVAAARLGGRGVPVACTRKCAPGTKALSVKAVRAGGATIHRMGLSETLLVFAEHRLFLSEPLAETVRRLRQGEPEKKIVVEVADVEEALMWAEAGCDVLQLEKFAVDEVARCRDRLDALNLAPGRVLLAAAGGVRADNAAAYVAAGADLLVTSAPYTAAPADVAVRFVSAG